MNKNELLRRYSGGKRDFINVDLQKICLMDTFLIDINLKSANLESSLVMRSYLINANLSSTNLKGANLWGTYLSNAKLSNVNLRNADLTGADLTGADLTSADLTGADLNGAKLIGTNLTDAKLTDIKTTEKTIFCNTIMPDGSVKNDHSRWLDGQELLRRYDAGERNFEGVVLHRADLRSADLHGINMFCAHLSYVNLSDAIFRASSLIGAKFIECELRRTNLKNSDLTNARLIYTDLRETKISGNITCTNFIEVSFQGAEFNGFGESLPLCYNVTLEDGEFIPGNSDCCKPI